MARILDLAEPDARAELRAAVYSDKAWQDFYAGRPIERTQQMAEMHRVVRFAIDASAKVDSQSLKFVKQNGDPNVVMDNEQPGMYYRGVAESPQSVRIIYDADNVGELIRLGD